MEKSLAPRLGNWHRAEWRRKCRQILADHLHSQLGILVEPSMVRLIPHHEDRYIWTRRPEREHLFQKQLSKHSIGAFMELCREIGVSFDALPRYPTTRECGADGFEYHGVPQSIVFLQSKVDELQAENSRFAGEITHSTDELRTESLAKAKAEGRVNELGIQLSASRTQEGVLAQENRRLSLKLRKLTKKMGHSEKEIQKALSTLCKLDPKRVENDSLS